MKLKEWNALDADTRYKLASIIFSLEGEEKIEAMARIWRHNVDDEHRKLLKAITPKEDGHFSLKFII